jgi:hypothetical protein
MEWLVRTNFKKGEEERSLKADVDVHKNFWGRLFGMHELERLRQDDSPPRVCRFDCTSLSRLRKPFGKFKKFVFLPAEATEAVVTGGGPI